jgi:predicted nuclease of predicted toxin-antitoxin system
MKIKIDENLPVEIADDLRALGHDALTVVDQRMTGIDDEGLMARVEEESRVFLTMDKGIANIQAYSPGRFAGLILFRPSQAGRGAVLAFVRKRLPKLLELDLKGHLLVVTETGIRIR